jgi:hypothetical protein
MRIKSIILGLILSSFSFVASAGAGHDHGDSHPPVDQATASTNATKIVAQLAKQKKIDESWGGISASSAEKKVFGDNSEWVVFFVNKKNSDTTKQKLYIFLSLGGEYIAANYTGK